MDISDWIDRHAAFTPQKPAIRFGGHDTSYAALALRIDALAGTLQQNFGITSGDRVGYLGHNHPDAIALLFACARLGAIFLPLNWRLEALEHREILTDCSPTILVSGPGFEIDSQKICAGLPVKNIDLKTLDADGAAFSATEPAGYDNPVLLCYTSGATGRPKGVVLDQNALFYNAINSTHMHAMTCNDVVLTTLPLFHVGGINIQSLPVLHAGGTLVLHPVFDVAASFDAIERDGITLSVFVPAQITALMADKRWQSADFSSLRVIATGSTMVSKTLINDFHRSGIPLIQVYGSTETAPLATYLVATDAIDKAGSAGQPALHCEMRIVDDDDNDLAQGQSGEIVIRGANVMHSYWNDVQTTREVLVDGWFHTGDIGHLDERGFLYVDDRKKDLIISGGENIYPAELENIMAECPTIVEAAVVGEANATWGESVVALVVLSPECAMTAAQIVALFDGRLAKYKHPRRVIFVETLPRNVMGKVLKDQLRQQVAQTVEAEPGAELAAGKRSTG